MILSHLFHLNCNVNFDIDTNSVAALVSVVHENDLETMLPYFFKVVKILAEIPASLAQWKDPLVAFKG